MMAACTNEELANPADLVQGKQMDASNFSLVSNSEGADTRLVWTPGYDKGDDNWVFPAAAWEANDAIGFTHIYTDQKIVTNYNFTTTATGDDIDAETGDAVFRTDNSTIFQGDYFVYYPFNGDYADYDGVPVKLEAIQEQDASVQIKASDKLEASNEANFKKAGEHLNKFSISNRISVDAKTQQQKFSLNPYMGNLYLKLYPVNQTNNIAVKRVEVSCEGGFVTSGRFLAKQGVAEPQFSAAEEKADKIVLTFNNISATDANENGLLIAKDTKKEDALMGYMSLMPATYSKLVFDIYYTETGNLKHVLVKKDINLAVESNHNYRMSLPIDADGAVEVTSYDIYNESEFAAAVKKSNAMNAGTDSKAVFTLKQDITLENAYRLDADVPVTFEGGKTITLKPKNDAATSLPSLWITSDKKVVINNVIKGGGDTNIYDDIKIGNSSEVTKKPDVTIAGINSKDMYVNVLAGSLVVKNEAAQGLVKGIYSRENLTLENSVVMGNAETNATSPNKGVLNLKNVVVKGNYTLVAPAAETAASSIENVTVMGTVTNASTINAKGDNQLSFYVDSKGDDKLADVTNNGTINVTAGTTTFGTLAAGVMNIDGTAIAMGAATLTDGKMVTINEDGTFVAEAALNNVEQTTINIEGTLETNGVVETLATGLKYCGTINNGAKGVWTLNAKLEQNNHAHGGKKAEFNNAGEVTVNYITATNSTAIGNMPKTLYNKVDNGRLVWRGMTSVSAIAQFVKLGDDKCWATDFAALVTPDNTETLSMTEDKDNTWDWSKKNIIIEVSGTVNNYYTINFTTEKPLTMKNLTIKLDGGLITTYTVDADKKAPYGIIVNETMKVLNVATANTPTYKTCPTKAVNLIVDGGATKTTITDAEKNLRFTGEYTQYNGTNIKYTEGSPIVLAE